jgi:hypothetical protein
MLPRDYTGACLVRSQVTMANIGLSGWDFRPESAELARRPPKSPLAALKWA